MNLEGRVVVVTGASSGIGKVTARELAKKGARVVAVARDEAKGKAALDDIRAEAGRDVSLELELCDFSKQKSIRAFCERLSKAHPVIDVLVNNAGGFISERKLTEDGLELAFGANHIGYFLTTTLLLDRLKAAERARIVVVASQAHRGQKMLWDDLDAAKSFSSIGRYGMSKLANILFTFELARRLAGSNVTANCLHPGVVGTNFGQTDGGWMKWGVKLVKPFLLTPEKGAATQIYLASSSEVEGVTGKYFDKKKPIEPSPEALDVASQKRLWELSEEIVNRSA